MTNQPDRRGPFRRMLEEHIAARLTNEVSEVDRQRIRDLVDVTNRSFLVTLSGGNLGPATADMTLQWCERGEVRSASVLVRTEAVQDGLLDLVIEGCPTELRFLCLLSGQFQIPSFKRHTEYLAQDKPRLPTVNVDANQLEEEYFSLDAAYDTSLAASSDDNDLFEQCSVNWLPGTTPEISLRAKADAGPFFGVIDASWEQSKGNRRNESTAIAMVDYRENEWIGRSHLMWPKGAKGKVVIRPMAREDLHLLDSKGFPDELSSLTNFLAVQNIRAWKVNQRDHCIRVSGIPAEFFHSNVDFVLRGVSATVPFNFELLWQVLESKVDRQLHIRVSGDGIYLRAQDKDDLKQEVAIAILNKTRLLTEMYISQGQDAINAYLYTIVKHCANHLYRKRQRRRELHNQDFNAVGDESESISFVPQIQESFDTFDELEEQESVAYIFSKFNRYLDERSRTVLLKLQDDMTRKELAAELGITEERVRLIESKATRVLKAVRDFQQGLKEFGFIDSGLITEQESVAVLDRLAGNKVSNHGLDESTIDQAEEIVYCIVAAISLNGCTSLTSTEMDQIDVWLQEFKFGSSKTKETTFADQSHDRLQRLGRRLHSKILLSRYEGNRKKMPETSRIYVEQRILKGNSWPDVLDSLKLHKACNPRNTKDPRRASEPLDPRSVPRRVKELWDKVPSVVPEEFRHLPFDELVPS